MDKKIIDALELVMPLIAVLFGGNVPVELLQIVDRAVHTAQESEGLTGPQKREKAFGLVKDEVKELLGKVLPNWAVNLLIEAAVAALKA